jgi:hypothetical protein
MVVNRLFVAVYRLFINIIKIIYIVSVVDNGLSHKYMKINRKTATN